METTEEKIKTFVKKWSVWFIFEAKKKELSAAMEQEIREILDSKTCEMKK